MIRLGDIFGDICGVELRLNGSSSVGFLGIVEWEMSIINHPLSTTTINDGLAMEGFLFSAPSAYTDGMFSKKLPLEWLEQTLL